MNRSPFKKNISLTCHCSKLVYMLLDVQSKPVQRKHKGVCTAG